MKIKRLDDPRALSQHAQLLDSCFPVPPGSSFFEDFPIWNPKFALKTVTTLGLFVNDRLVATAGLRKGEMGKFPSPLKLGMIGAVATSPHYRGQGLASYLIQALLQEAEKQDLDLLILWGSEPLYEKFGFKLCGEQFTVPLQVVPALSFENQTFHQGWTPALFEKLSENSKRVILIPEDRNWFEAHKNVLWYFSGDPRAPKAYAALGRGIDLVDIIHEWGGEKSHLLSLFSYLKTLHPQASVLGSRSLLTDLGVSLKEFPLQYLCMAKPLNPAALRAFFGETYDPEKGIPADFWIWGLDAC